MGWKQEILTGTDEKVVNSNGATEEYSRTMNYLQIPVFAHLAWGKEKTGWNFFVQAGPQIGLFLGESTVKNYETPNLSTDGTGRSNTIIAQESMPVEHKFDYGIAAGLGAEWSNHRLGHFLLEEDIITDLGIFMVTRKKISLESPITIQ